MRARRQRRRPALPYVITSFVIGGVLVAYLRWRHNNMASGDDVLIGVGGVLALGLALYALLIMYRLLESGKR